MIYSYLNGRIGNCLFEIAAGASLAKRLGLPFRAMTCDPEILSTPDDWSLSEYLKPYKKSILRKIDFQDNYPADSVPYEESSFNYTPLPLQKDMILKGYFQSEKYFDKEYVRDLFAIDPEIEFYIRDKYGDILNEKVVSVHVRRGDYLKIEVKHPVCRMGYFKRAMAHFPPSIVFLVFSDDIKWCKKHFKGDNFHFVDKESPLVDLYLQSLCSHNIISNSTFSWWGAWLNSNPDKKVIYPSPWFGIHSRKILDTKDLCPKEWIEVPMYKKYELFFRENYLWIKFKMHRCFGCLRYLRFVEKRISSLLGNSR